MGLSVPDRRLITQGPKSQIAISTTGDQPVQFSRMLGHGVDSIDVAREGTDKGFGKHTFHFCRVEGTGVFAGLFKGVEGGVEVALEFVDVV